MQHPFFEPDGTGAGAARLLEALRMDLPEETFGALALALLRQQARTVKPYARLLDGLGVDPDALASWKDFPALPAAAFRDQAVCAFDPAEAVAVFETSGTSGPATGRHHFRSTTYYEKAFRTAFGAMMPALGVHRWVMLVPPFHERPHSSLAFMLTHLAEALAPDPVVWCVDAQYQLDAASFHSAVEKSPGPVALFGTSFALAQVAEEHPLPLPRGSVVFDTGGMKGRRRSMERAEFLDCLQRGLGVAPDAVWNEYGMTEWSSQGYARMDQGLHRFPPWMRIVLRDPETGAETPPGAIGLVQAYDLANVGSVMAVATRDAARWEPGGLRLLGRWQGAEPRGCSLPYE